MTEVTDVDLGHRFAAAVAAKDGASLRALLADPIDFRGLTPNAVWAGDDVQSTVEIVFEHWFEPSDHIERLLDVSTSHVADRRHVRYLLEVSNDAGRHLVEQQAYYTVTDGRISWMRVLCSGFRRIDD
jgi:hypothetical protein